MVSTGGRKQGAGGERQIQAAQRREPGEGAGGPAEMDPATFLATLPPALRQEILMTTDESLLPRAARENSVMATRR